jgi:acyl-CoA dehydrogenase
MSYSSLGFDSARLFNPFITEQHHEWRDQLRRFLDKEVMPFAENWDEAGQMPDELWPRAAEMGLLGLGYPEEYGGVSKGELARLGVGGVSASLMVHNIGLPPVINFAREAVCREVAPAVLSGQKFISLCVTEPSGGSDVARLSTTARDDGDAWVVNGCKTYITGGMRADWFTTAVRTGGEGARGVSVLLIPADLPGVSRTELTRKQGWWASDTATIYFEDVRVPKNLLIGEENQGFKVLMNNFNDERMAMSAAMEACARVCLEEAVNWAQERQTFGKRLADHQVIRHKIAEMKRYINATQCYLQVVSHHLDAGMANAGDIALLKVQSSHAMEFCAREAMQIMGGAAYMRGSRVERIYREVRVNAIGGGSEEIMRDLAARQYGV